MDGLITFFQVNPNPTNVNMVGLLSARLTFNSLSTASQFDLILEIECYVEFIE